MPRAMPKQTNSCVFCSSTLEVNYGLETYHGKFALTCPQRSARASSLTKQQFRLENFAQMEAREAGLLGGSSRLPRRSFLSKKFPKSPVTGVRVGPRQPVRTALHNHELATSDKFRCALPGRGKRKNPVVVTVN